MTKILIGLVHLSRFRDYTATVIITTLLGFLITNTRFNSQLSGRMALVLIANLLAVAFIFMFNDTEDAQDDAKDKQKALRNPVSSGIITSDIAHLTSAVTAFLSLLIFYYLGKIPFIVGSLTIIIGTLYSFKIFRLKSIPIVDLISHGLMIAGLQLLCAYFTLVPNFKFDYLWIIPFLAIVLISIRGQFYNQIRDFVCDRNANINNSTFMLGLKKSNYLMKILWVLAGTLIAGSIIIKIIPLWLIIPTTIFMGFYAILIKHGLKSNKSKNQTFDFQNQVLSIVLLVLTVWTIVRFL